MTAPTCRYHPHSRMVLVPADVPAFVRCCNGEIGRKERGGFLARLREANPKLKHTARMIWRCPRRLLLVIDGKSAWVACPWVQAGAAESCVTDSERSRFLQEGYGGIA